MASFLRPADLFVCFCFFQSPLFKVSFFLLLVRLHTNCLYLQPKIYYSKSSRVCFSFFFGLFLCLAEAALQALKLTHCGASLNLFATIIPPFAGSTATAARSQLFCSRLLLFCQPQTAKHTCNGDGSQQF